MEDRRAMSELIKAKPYLTKQEYKVVRGQMRAGDTAGAMKGLGRLLRRKGKA